MGGYVFRDSLALFGTLNVIDFPFYQDVLFAAS
jgi:hypothetical protein